MPRAIALVVLVTLALAGAACGDDPAVDRHASPPEPTTSGGFQAGDAVATARAVENGMAWEVDVTLTPSATSTFATFTKDATGEQAAIVVDGILRSAPTVEAEISSGRLVIAPLEDRTTAEAIAASLGGAAP